MVPECSRVGCTTPAYAYGKCKKHGKEDGDIVVAECKEVGCDKDAQHDDRCWLCNTNFHGKLHHGQKVRYL